MTIALQFDDLDQLAETIWAMIAQATFINNGDRRQVAHDQWERLAPEGRRAAREIAAEIAKIFRKELRTYDEGYSNGWADCFEETWRRFRAGELPEWKRGDE